MRVADTGDERIEAAPGHAAALTTLIQPFKQKPHGLTHILATAPTVATDSVILDVAVEMSSDVLHHDATAVRSQFSEAHAQSLRKRVGTRLDSRSALGQSLGEL